MQGRAATSLGTERRRGSSGFTLIEMLFSLSLFVVLMFSVHQVVTQSSGAYRATRASARLEDKVRQGLSRAVAEVYRSGRGVLNPDPTGNFGTESLGFQQLVGVVDGVPDFGVEQHRLVLEYDPRELDDGVDNDGDGLIDEGQLVFVRYEGEGRENRVVLCKDVRELLEGEIEDGDDDNGNGVSDERGFNIHRIGDVLTLRLSVEGLDPDGRVLTRTLTTSVLLRN